MKRVVIIILLFTSCSQVKEVQKGERILQEFWQFYLNDSLKFSYRMGGDYEPVNKKREINKSLKINRLPLKSNNCIAYFKTFLPPPLEHYLYYYQNVEQVNKSLSKLGINTETNQLPFFDSLNFRAIYSFQLSDNKGFINIIGLSPEREMLNLVPEYKDLFQNIKTGNDYQNRFTDPFTLARNFDFNIEDSTTNYLRPIKILSQHRKNYENNIVDKNIYIQAFATYQSFITNLEDELENLISEWRNMTGFNDNKYPDLKYLATDKQALTYLIEQCKTQRIVMFNENHFQPNHRFLIMLLLKDLYEQGFRYLGLEMLWDKDINQRGFAVRKSGFYTREPNASNLIKEAIKLGYNVFGYEGKGQNRGKQQAENIYNQTFGIDSAAKVLILTGTGHINRNDKERVVAELINNYNINPLTVNQVVFQTKSDNWLSVIDTVSIPANKSFKADINVSNNLTYYIFG